MAGVHFLLARDLLGGFLVDLLHRIVSGRRLALLPQQAVHQEPVAREGQAFLELLAVFDLLVLCRLGDDLHVDEERQHVVLFGCRIHLRQARSEFLLSECDVALADLRAVHLCQHGIGVFGPYRQTGKENHCETAGHGSRGEAKAQAGFRFRERGGHEKSLWGCLGRRDTRPIMGRWQRENSVKMMKSLRGFTPLTSLWPSHISAKPKSMAM